MYSSTDKCRCVGSCCSGGAVVVADVSIVAVVAVVDAVGVAVVMVPHR